MNAKICSGFVLFLLLSGCAAQAPSAPSSAAVITVTDSANKTIDLNRPKTVVALSSSIAEIWLLAGGRLSGVTSDATGERRLDLPEDITIVGSVKDPVMEKILELNPELVLITQDIASHASIGETLRNAGITYYTAKVETLDEYLKVLRDFTLITGEAESYEQNGEPVKQKVDALLSRVTESDSEPPTALFLRAYSTGVKVKAREHTVCTILDDAGVVNIAKREGFPLEELSREAILEADPDYIFVVTMGDEQAAISSLEASLLSNPAFSGLSAIKNNRLVILSKELYHFKPNNRWGEAYETLLKIIYPDEK